jgi:hypothetical protein
MRMDIVMWDDDIIIDLTFVLDLGMQLFKDLTTVV